MAKQSNKMISSDDLARMRALKANDWDSPLSERGKEAMADLEEIAKMVREGGEVIEKKAPGLLEAFRVFLERIEAEVDKEARDALARGTHYVFDRVRVHRGMSGKKIDRLLNKRGLRDEDLLLKEKINFWSYEIVVLRKKEGVVVAPRQISQIIIDYFEGLARDVTRPNSARKFAVEVLQAIAAEGGKDA